MDLGAYGSLGDIKYGEHSQRYCKRLGRSAIGGGGVSREGTGKKTQKHLCHYLEKMVNSS